MKFLHVKTLVFFLTADNVRAGTSFICTSHTPHLGQYASLSWITITIPFPRTITSSLRHPLPLESLNFTVCSSGTQRKKKLLQIYFHSLFLSSFFFFFVTSPNANPRNLWIYRVKKVSSQFTKPLQNLRPAVTSTSRSHCLLQLSGIFRRCHPLT